LQAWYFEIFQSYPWQLDDDSVHLFPAMTRWGSTQRKRRGSKTRVTVDFKMVSRVLSLPSRETFNLFPWSRFAAHQLGDALVVTAQRKWLTGLTCDSMYLGERVVWQHGPNLLPVAPAKPPRHMLDIDRMSAQDKAMYKAGVPASMYAEDEPYSFFVRRVLRSPQVIAREATTSGPAGVTREANIPEGSFSFVRADGVRVRVPVPSAPRLPEAYRVDPDEPVRIFPCLIC
jgi:hypothetical protein